MPQTIRSGGAEQRRGAWYQDWSLLFYVLTRLIKYPDLEIAVESIEDATIYYNLSDGTITKLVTEYIQCKKHEKRDSGSVHVGSNEQDRWLKGTFYIAELEEWIDTEREGIVTADLLKANPDSFYTALVFGYLQNKLERFVPKDIKPYIPILYPLPYFNEQFPVAYRHTEEPSATAKGKLGGEEPRKRIRIVPTGSPQELKTMCWFMLTNAPFYGVSKHKADSVLNELQNLIIEASQVQGKMAGQEVIAVARQARTERGIWQSADRILRKEYARPSDINKGAPLNWHDFEHQRFADRPEFSTTWDAVKDQGDFVVISGAVGTGKTSLCLHLMYKFLKASPNNRAYYLTVLPATPLTDEVKFLESNIDTDTLFIVDDEHIAAEEVRSLIEKFWDYKTSARARLVVSSKTNYGRTEALAAGRTAKELRQAIQVALPHNSIETVEQLISEIRLKTQLQTQLSDRELATLGGGVLGEALLIARATRELIGSSTMEGIFNKQQLKSQITEWILSYLPGLNSEDDFNSQVAPIFVISAFGLPVPESYSSSIINRLQLVGFLERYDVEENARLYRASDTNLAFILQSQHKHAHLSILQDYVERYPQWLPHALTRMADWKESQETLERLSQRKLDVIVNLIKDPSSEFSLTDIVNILQSIRWASRGTARTIYRRWALPFSQPNEYFLPDIITRARNVRELTRLLNLVLRIDKDVLIAAQLAESQLMPHEARTILFHITGESCQLDEAATCLHALRTYSKKFADQLYEALTNSPEFAQKLGAAESSDNGLFVLLRYCEQIKGLNRADAYRSVEKYLPKDKIVDTILVKIGNINPLSQFLLRLHRLYPIWAANVLSIILTSHAAKFTGLLQQEKNFDTLSQELHSFSQVNRLAAVQITYGIFAHLVDMLQSERKYSIIGANIETIRKYISTNLARRLSDSMDEDEVLQLLLRERRYVDVVGRFLFLLTKASPGKAAWFEEQLDYRFFLRVARAPRLRDVVILVRGFLAAASFQRVGQLQQRMLSDSSLIGLLKKRWQEGECLNRSCAVSS